MAHIKWKKDGRYRNLQINVPKFVENKRLVVTAECSITMDENVDFDLTDLLIKRMGTINNILIDLKIFLGN